MPDAVPASQNIKTDSVLWYNVDIFGVVGYGVPNPSNDIGTLNPQIADLTALIGKSLFHVMHHEDVDLSRPPSINTLTRIHQLYVRAGQIITARAVPANKLNFEMEHVSPAGEVFRVWPVPYFRVRNPHLKRWASTILALLTNMFQHTENRKTVEISTDFGQMVGDYLFRVYRSMAIEMFGKPAATVDAAGFVLTSADLAAYDPGKYFTSQEMVDTVPALENVFTEDRKAALAAGILLSDLPPLQPWPSNLQTVYERLRANSVAATQSVNASGAASGATGQQGVFPAGSSFVG